jgi:hypothetical protein
MSLFLLASLHHMSSGIGEVWREGQGFSAETTEKVVDRSSLQ